MHRPRFEIAIFGKGGYFYRAYNGRQTKATAGREAKTSSLSPAAESRRRRTIGEASNKRTTAPSLTYINPKSRHGVQKKRVKRRFVECEGGS